MKILHTVEYYSPSMGGAQEVVRQISEKLVQRGHAVTVATTRLARRKSNLQNGVKIEEFEISGNAVRGFQGETERYQEFLQTSNFDIMLNYAAQEWTADLAFPIIRNLSYPTVLVPCGFSGFYKLQYADYFHEMAEVFRAYSHLVFHAGNYRDINLARQNGIKHYTIIPNGASQREFECTYPSFRKQFNITDDMPLLLTVGSHTRLKGHKLVMKAFRKAKIGQAVLVIIGNVIHFPGCLPSCLARSTWMSVSTQGEKRVLVLDLPRTEVVAAFQAADLFVFGSNIEYSPLVLFEAMASHTPFISVACGNASEIVSWGQGGITIPTMESQDGRVSAKPEVMAKAIEELIDNKPLRDQLAQKGYQSWRDRFTWENITGLYEALYFRLTGK